MASFNADMEQMTEMSQRKKKPRCQLKTAWAFASL